MTSDETSTTISPPTADGRPLVLIVGSGAAGMFAAHRLADVADVTLIEAGSDGGTPSADWLHSSFVFGPGVDWGYFDAETELFVPRGKVTGGSTSTNSAAALRGQPWDFDEWQVDGWSWTDILPAFTAIESDLRFGHDPHHGSSSPLPINRLAFSPLDRRFADWAIERGHAWVDDQNAPGALGVGEWPTNMTDAGERIGLHDALLPHLRDRVGLRTSTEVVALVLDGGRVTGVDVIGANGQERILADRVVLAAGSYNSPAILLRSGIGPRADLEALGIPVVRDLPGVGGNLQDHPWTVLQVVSADPTSPGQRPINGALLRYETDPADHVEVHLYPHQARPYIPEADPADAFVGMGLMRAVSRGSVTIDDAGQPVIALRHLSDAADRRAFEAVLDEATRFVDDMVAEGTFLMPDSPWWKDADRGAQLAAHLDSYGHAVGTCRMGPADDELAVVGPDLALHGIEGLSVIDASVMPVSPRANTMLATMAVGWHGAGLLAERLHVDARSVRV